MEPGPEDVVPGDMPVLPPVVPVFADPVGPVRVPSVPPVPAVLPTSGAVVPAWPRRSDIGALGLMFDELPLDIALEERVLDVLVDPVLDDVVLPAPDLDLLEVPFLVFCLCFFDFFPEELLLCWVVLPGVAFVPEPVAMLPDWSVRGVVEGVVVPVAPGVLVPGLVPCASAPTAKHANRPATSR